MALFDSHILRRIASPESFRRGRVYMEQGNVESIQLEQLPSGDLFVYGTVYGSVAYHPKLTIAEDRSEIVAFDCDCPSRDEFACKHVIALGYVAMRRSAVQKSPKTSARKAEDPLLETLRGYAQKRGVGVGDEHIERAVKRLESLLVRKGTAGIKYTKQAPPEEFSLGEIEMSFSFDPARDVICVKAAAVYGPMKFPVEGFEPLQTEGETEQAALRDWKAERHAARRLEHEGFHLVRVGEFELPGAQAYRFLRVGLIDLSKTVRVLVDDAFQKLTHIKKRQMTSEWNVSESSGEDWLRFSVEWKCGDRPLSVEEIEGLANGYRQSVRDVDGSFVEIENETDVARLLAFIKKARSENGEFMLLRSRALELAFLAEEFSAVRLEETSTSVAAFLRDAKEGRLRRAPIIPTSLSGLLRPYQSEAVAWALFLRAYKFGGVLADDMGLGKTLQALAIIATERPAGAAPSMVICPKTLIPVWEAEAKRFTPELSVVVVDGTGEARKAAHKRAAHADIIITSYSMFQRDAKVYQSIPLFYAILDEAQYVKNSKTTTALAVKTLNAQHRLALTGTPLENGVHELWSLFDFLMPGLLGDHAQFRSEFERPIRENQDMDALHALKRRVKPFLLRRTKESVAPELPPRTEETNWCELTTVQASVYAEVLARVRKDVFEAVEKKGFNRSRLEILAALTRLRQVCNHPALLDKDLPKTAEVSGKMAYALELVREAAAGGHKILLFSQFTSMLDLLRPALDKMHIGHVTIEGKTQKRGEVVEKFRGDASISVFLLSLRAAGTGLTLTEADTVILFDPWWNPMVERQAMDRAHRIGQTKSVNVHKLATKGTIEERVLSLQEKKKAVFDAMVSDTAEALSGLTWEDVQDMFAEV